MTPKNVGPIPVLPLTRTHYSVLPLIFRYAQFCPSSVSVTYRNALLHRYRPVKVLWPSRKNSRKNQKNMKFGGIEDSHVRKARAHFCVGWTLRELVAKENKNNLCLWAVNSKKIAKKFKKIEFIWRQRGLSAQGACKFWWSNDVRGALEKKNKIVHFFKVFLS